MNGLFKLVIALGTFTCLPDALAQRLLIPDSANGAIMEFDPFSGQLIRPIAVDLDAVTGGAARVPIEVMEAPNGELWVSDMVADTVFRLTGDGSQWVGTAGGPLDQCRGLAPLGPGALVANSGSSGGAPGDSLAQVDAAGKLITSAAIGDPFDVVPFTFQGVPGFLVSDISGDDLVFAEGADLQNQSLFHGSNGVSGVDTPNQIHVSASGRVFVAGASTPVGIYEYDASGAEIAYIDTSSVGGVRGVYLLGNGNLLFSTGSGVHVYETSTALITTLLQGVSGRSITLYSRDLCACDNYCTANVNSTGTVATISVTGSGRVTDNDLLLTTSSVPTFSFGFFITSRFQGFVATPSGSAGNLCLAGSIGRYVGPGQTQNSGASGAFSLDLDLTRTPQPNGLVAITPGQTWHFQAWFRDAVGGLPTSNFTDGVRVVFF
ncbi:hypothetical protein Poly30_34670 [Planctomycetes bacterium Poly30]|uniref:NHL repeat protein n=1 Tax=Saltatorellus ferox TaxID=2528018 RepID=A0A518EV39_9BACT|nr:hypothetical protein Poly30_34670 [Planctomycetes bacterium Poly30]